MSKDVDVFQCEICLLKCKWHDKGFDLPLSLLIGSSHCIMGVAYSPMAESRVLRGVVACVRRILSLTNLVD